jgi:hypothetical protein
MDGKDSSGWGRGSISRLHLSHLTVARARGPASGWETGKSKGQASARCRGIIIVSVIIVYPFYPFYPFYAFCPSAAIGIAHVAGYSVGVADDTLYHPTQVNDFRAFLFEVPGLRFMATAMLRLVLLLFLFCLLVTVCFWMLRLQVPEVCDQF